VNTKVLRVFWRTLSVCVLVVLVCDGVLAQEKGELIPVIEGISSPDFGYITSYLARARDFLQAKGSM
jgi:hypothetical protein